jgi:hypothetical protein
MDSQTRMYVMTHKDFKHPKMEEFFPLQVGSALHEDLGYLRDDTGDNISCAPVKLYQGYGIISRERRIHEILFSFNAQIVHIQIMDIFFA